MPAFFPIEVWDGEKVTSQAHGVGPDAREWNQLLSEFSQLQQCLFYRFSLDFGALRRYEEAEFTIGGDWTHINFAQDRSGNAWDNEPFGSDISNSCLYLTGKNGTILHSFLFYWMVNWASSLAEIQFEVAINGTASGTFSPARGKSLGGAPQCTSSFGIARIPNEEKWSLSLSGKTGDGSKTIDIYSTVFTVLSIKAPRLREEEE